MLAEDAIQAAIKDYKNKKAEAAKWTTQMIWEITWLDLLLNKVNADDGWMEYYWLKLSWAWPKSII